MSRARPVPVAGVHPVSTGTVRLRADGPDWVLDVNRVPSSAVRPSDPGHLAFPYQALLLALIEAVTDGPVRAVHLGGAGCALPWAVAVRRPGSRQVVAEVDAELARLVRTWFELPAAPDLRIRAQDAAELLASRPDGSADVVVRDAFTGDRTPGHLATLAFTADVARVLAAGGVYLANVADRDQARNRGEIASVTKIFEDVGVVTERSGRAANRIVVAGAGVPWPTVTRAVHRAAPGALLLRGEPLLRFLGGARALR